MDGWAWAPLEQQARCSFLLNHRMTTGFTLAPRLHTVFFLQNCTCLCLRKGSPLQCIQGRIKREGEKDSERVASFTWPWWFQPKLCYKLQAGLGQLRRTCLKLHLVTRKVDGSRVPNVLNKEWSLEVSFSSYVRNQRYCTRVMTMVKTDSHLLCIRRLMKKIHWFLLSMRVQ